MVVGEILSSKEWTETVVRHKQAHKQHKQKILVRCEDGREEFFTGPLVDSVSFARGQKALIAWGSTDANKGEPIYVENLNTREVRSSGPFSAPLGFFGLSFGWATWIAVTSALEVILLALIDHMPPALGVVYVIQWAYVSLLLFWQIRARLRKFKISEQKAYASLAVETGKAWGIDFDPESCTETTGYRLVRV